MLFNFKLQILNNNIYNNNYNFLNFYKQIIHKNIRYNILIVYTYNKYDR